MMIFPRLAAGPLIGLTVAVLAGAASARTGDEAGADAGMVWEVAGGKNSLYLAGSIHVLGEDDHPLPPAYDEAYAASDSLVFEVPQDEMTSPEVIQLMGELSMLEQGDSLEAWLGAEDYKRVIAQLKASGKPIAIYGRMRPWVLAIDLAMAAYSEAGASPAFGVEALFELRAEEDEKPSVGLETAAFQLNLLAGFSRESEALMLTETLDEIDSLAELFTDMVAAWRSGALFELEELLNHGLGDDPELKKKLLDERNEAWVVQLKEMLEEGDEDVMVIVGAGHLVGQEGVPILLEKEGYELRRLVPATLQLEKP